MGALTAAQWKEIVLFVVFVASLFCMIWIGGIMPLRKALDERGSWQGRAWAKRWMAECEEERQADETGYVIMQTMKEILKNE